MKGFKATFAGLGLLIILLVVIPLIKMVISADAQVMQSTISDLEVMVSMSGRVSCGL